jgi:hypothetical protein
MKHIQPYQLFENVESQRDIEILANIIINNVSNQLDSKLRQSIADNRRYYMAWGLWVNDISSQFAGKGFSRKFMRMIKTRSMHIRFVENTENPIIKGTAYQGSIEVYIEPEDIAKIREYTDAATKGDIAINGAYLMRDIIVKYRSTLVHEIQHVIDDWLSNGKFKDKNHNSAMYKAHYQQEYDDYYKLSHEINARYTQVVSSMGYSLSYTDKYGFEYHPSFNWENYVTTFKHMFLGWELMTDVQQKRLLSRLSQQYHYLTKHKEKLCLDIKANVERLESELQEAGIHVYMYYKHSANYIHISRLLAPTEVQEEEAIEKIVKLAETYRKTVGITPYKGHNGIKMKTFIPLLKKLGFKGNSNKYGGRRDYSISEDMFRVPRRKLKVIGSVRDKS